MKIRFLMIIMVLWSSSIAHAQIVLDRIVATVNDEVITARDLDTQLGMLLIRYKESEVELPPTEVLKEQLLERIILQKLQLQLAKRFAITVSDSIVNNVLEQAYKDEGFASLAAMKEFYAEESLDFAQYLKSLKDELTITSLQQQLLLATIPVSQQEIQALLNSPQGMDQGNTEYHLAHILLPFPEPMTAANKKRTQELAAEIIANIKNGKTTFAAAAISHSKAMQALNGGDLGWRKAAELPTSFANIVPAMAIGEISEPVADNYGVHIISLKGKKSHNMQRSSKIKQYLIRHILVKDQQAAQELHAKISSDLEFTEIAKKTSLDKASRASGGMLGWLNSSQLDKNFLQAVSKLKIHEISAPFHTAAGWHIAILLNSRNAIQADPILEEEARNLILHKKFQEQLHQWLRKLRQTATVEVFSY